MNHINIALDWIVSFWNGLHPWVQILIWLWGLISAVFKILKSAFHKNSLLVKIISWPISILLEGLFFLLRFFAFVIWFIRLKLFRWRNNYYILWIHRTNENYKWVLTDKEGNLKYRGWFWKSFKECENDSRRIWGIFRIKKLCILHKENNHEEKEGWLIHFVWMKFKDNPDEEFFKSH